MKLDLLLNNIYIVELLFRYLAHFKITYFTEILGMNSQTLLHDLVAGMRLPSPIASTPRISHLIQTCWLAAPTERPSFSKIKQVIYDELLDAKKDSVQNVEDYLLMLRYNEGQTQYKAIKSCNSYSQRQYEHISTEINVIMHTDMEIEPLYSGANSFDGILDLLFIDDAVDTEDEVYLELSLLTKPPLVDKMDL